MFIHKGQIKTIFVCFLCISLLVNPVVCNSWASWVDDWLDNALTDTVSTSAGPSSIKGATRRYYSGGYNSIRWKTKTIHPVSISPPRISFGCGGIDVFWGGFDLLDFDYLVQRLKSVMQIAAVFAFKYALSRLSEKANQILDAIDATVNFLNSLQLNECMAGKAIATVAMSPFSKEAANEMGTVWNQFKQSTGFGSSWQRMVDSWNGILNSGSSGSSSSSTTNTSFSLNATDVDSLNSGCSAEINNDILGKTFLEYLVSKKNAIPSDFLPLARGLLGDLYVSGSGAVIEINSCLSESYKKGVDIVQVFLDNSKGVHVCSSISGDECDCSNIINGGVIKSRIKDYLNDYFNALWSFSTANSNAQSFIANIRGFPVYEMLRQAYQVGMDASDLISLQGSALVDCSAYFFGAGLIANVIHEAEEYIKYIDNDLRAYCSKSDVGKCVVCKADVMEAIKQAIKDYRDNASDFIVNVLRWNVFEQSERLRACMQMDQVTSLLASLDKIRKTSVGLW